MNKNNIGEFISKLRKEKGLTQQELAKLLNVTDRAISNYETGRRIPDISLYKPICDVFDITVSELINGERINEDKLLISSNNTIINTLKKNKKDKNRLSLIIKILFLILIALVYILINYYKDLYPKIDIYNFSVSNVDDIEKQKLEKMYTFDNRNIYYYGIGESEICDIKKCYELIESLIHKQTDIDKIKTYFDSQMYLSNITGYTLYDGGTTIYKNNGLSIIFCKTIDNNNDIYIGTSEMVERLDNAYCGHPQNETKKFVRTYKVLSATLVDNEFMNVVLENNSGEKGKVKVHISNNLVVGRTYEFSFFTYEKFKDTIENIFKYSTFLEAKETDKHEFEQVNDEIIVNSYLESDVELNELENVTMTIKEGTLTKESATVIIKDLNGNKYSYGEEFRIDKYENGIWKEVRTLGINYAFNMMAYGVDLNGVLEFNCKWGYMYGALEPGEYRIVKYALPNLERPITKEDKKYFSVEFTLK